MNSSEAPAATADRRAVMALIALWALSTLLWITPGILRPDGAGYLSYLVSGLLDRDLLFFNEWERFRMIDQGRILHKEVTVTGHLGNHWTVGSALFWLPSYLYADLIVAVSGRNSFPRDGISLPYNLAVVTSSAVAGLLTLLISYGASRRFSSPGSSILATAGLWFGSPLLWYSLKNSVMSHAVSSMAAAAIVGLSLMLRDRPGRKMLFAVGLIAGFACTVRPQNAPFVLVPLIIGGLRIFGGSRHGIFFYGGGGLLGALPQLIVSYFLYGDVYSFASGGGAKPFAAFERIWIWEPLFSWYHGLISWTPFIGLGLWGLYFLWRKDRQLTIAALYCFGTQWFVNAALERSFWGAFSFGQRRFDNCAIFFALGAAALFQRVGTRWGAVLVAATSTWTLSLFFAAGRNLDLSIYYTPAELCRLAFSGLFAAVSSPALLAYVPPVAKLSVILLLVAFLGGWGVSMALLMARPLRRHLPLIAAIYFAVVSLALVVCGVRGRAQLPRYAALIEYNRALSSLPGGADIRVGLMTDEINYLRKSGRTEEASRTERELRGLLDARERSIRDMKRP